MGSTETPLYDELCMAEFVSGFLGQAEYEAPDVRDIQLAYLRRLMDDAVLHDWDLVRGFHGIVLSHIDQGRLTWDDSNGMDRQCTTFLYGASASKKKEPKPSAGQGGKPKTETNVRYHYQSGTCTQQGAHRFGNRLLQHGCLYCFKWSGRVYPHPENQCQSKTKSSTNVNINTKNGHEESRA